MDQAARTDRTPALTVADGDAVAIRAQIEETRAELGDTVAALAVKADVKQQARNRVETIKRRFARRRGERSANAGAASPDSVAQTRQSFAAQAQAHPLPLIAAFAILAGFLLGRMTAG